MKLEGWREPYDENDQISFSFRVTGTCESFFRQRSVHPEHVKGSTICAKSSEHIIATNRLTIVQCNPNLSYVQRHQGLGPCHPGVRRLYTLCRKGASKVNVIGRAMSVFPKSVLHETVNHTARSTTRTQRADYEINVQPATPLN